jgi:hypothetical protein
MPVPATRQMAQLAFDNEAETRKLEHELWLVNEKRMEFEGRYWALRNEIGPTGFTLVGADGRLPEDAQRALSALASRSATRGPLLAGLKLARRVSRPGGNGS